MNSINTFSLSLQKQIENQNILFDSEINRAFNELNFRTLLNRSGITKKKGYATVTLLFLIVLLPFLKLHSAISGTQIILKIRSMPKRTFTIDS